VCGEGSVHHGTRTCEPGWRVAAEPQRSASDACGDIVSCILVCIDGVIHQRPAHASAVERGDDGVIKAPMHCGPSLCTG
jgi:hypothetical protein